MLQRTSIPRPGPAPWAADARLAPPQLPDAHRQTPYDKHRLNLFFKLLLPYNWTQWLPGPYSLPYVPPTARIPRHITSNLYHLIVFKISPLYETVDQVHVLLNSEFSRLGYKGAPPILVKGEKGVGIRCGYAVLAFESCRDALAVLTILSVHPMHPVEIDSLRSDLAPDWVLNDVNPYHPGHHEALLHFHRQAQIFSSTETRSIRSVGPSTSALQAAPQINYPPPSTNLRPAGTEASSNPSVSGTRFSSDGAPGTSSVVARPAAPTPAASSQPWTPRIGVPTEPIQSPILDHGAALSSNSGGGADSDDPGPDVVSKQTLPPTPPPSPEQVRVAFPTIQP